MVKKNYSRGGRTCRVTFDVPAEVGARKAWLCGEFNEWNRRSHPMSLRKDGRFSITLSLAAGRDYRFRYFIDNDHWENDWAADDYVSNEFGTEDSVVKV